jgi:hypothetical protein
VTRIDPYWGAPNLHLEAGGYILCAPSAVPRPSSDLWQGCTVYCDEIEDILALSPAVCAD